MKEKEELEKEVKQYQDQVTVYKEKDLDDNLIDEEGFPRDDINFEELRDYKILKRTIIGIVKRKNK